MNAPFRDESLTLPRPRVLILGASTRAVAGSVWRAGFDPVCVDQFADADLRALAEVASFDAVSNVTGVPDGPLFASTPEWSELPVLYAGGMENHADLLERLERDHTVWGSRRTAIATVRDPRRLVDGLTVVKQRVLPVQLAGDAPPRDGSWMLKPVASGGGRGIFAWDENAPDPAAESQHYFQQRVEGRVYSALFLAETVPGDVRFIGLTRQLVGCPELHARPFAWCGNIGPVTLSLDAEILVRRWGNILKWKFGLTGLYGLDFIVDESGHPWLLEVNPRLTASVEIFELACGLTLLADHVACYDDDAAAISREYSVPPASREGERLGRAILYAPYRLRSRISLPDPLGWATAPQIADIPVYDSVIESGQPVCSVYAWGDDEAAVTKRLMEAAARVEQHLERVDP